MADDALPEQEPVTFDPIVNCIVFDASGRIRQSGACARSLLDVHAAYFGDGFTAMEVPEGQFDRDIDADAYVLDGVITPKGTVLSAREITIEADGVSSVMFPVPAGSTVMHDGETIEIDDGEFEFSSDDVGSFDFFFAVPPAFKDFRVTIHAV
ncbi:hypothetical protein [Rhizobium sp. SG570]|uniref:hypothetical protein n=1 Tax=Rhizobium sp. SG570 TaxID=2587113 RepID=UPI001446A015|nr:hypothetical protein [Rhizobium sp. SG570]NKJ34101.1 hypothetical protein [Rhizobium sp. SG570]